MCYNYILLTHGSWRCTCPKCRMLECPGTEEQIDSISTRCGVDRIIAKNFDWARGGHGGKGAAFWIRTTSSFRSFLLPDMERAVARLQRAMREGGEQILVVGDSDADGITATAIMMQYLQKPPANAHYTIPDNGDNLSLFSQQSLADMLARGVRLIVTVDLGVSAVEQITAFQARGIDVIVNRPPRVQKGAARLLCGYRPQTPALGYPFDGLSGAGVALKLVCAHALRYGDMRAAFYELRPCRRRHRGGCNAPSRRKPLHRQPRS